ncbi:uncharacterized protein LOC143854044 isoform X2 [Tasmannia lanceolata]|uniref:uncharacterized protein LOC143854044 isoform X2 n=1 Tax=Tasmannia lanceolata TaxID=3420 RepID=UPI0040635817
MNNAMKTAFNSSHMASINLRAAFFHSTHVSERRRKTHWESSGSSFGSKRFNNYAKRVKRMEAKKTLLRNVGAYAEYLFQSWKSGDDKREESSREGPSWFTKHHSTGGTKRKSYGSQESQWKSYRGRGFHFCFSDDEGVETIFRSAFGGEQYFYWSFDSADNFQWRNSSGYSNYRNSWNSRYRLDDEYDSSADYGSLESDLISDRLALGLSASGPLKLEQVKSAYRACALKWHPDRHQGFLKVEAEEKFKHCSAAYKSLCDRFAIN